MKWRDKEILDRLTKIEEQLRRLTWAEQAAWVLESELRKYLPGGIQGFSAPRAQTAKADPAEFIRRGVTKGAEMKVWIVSQGMYSDCHIVGVHTSAAAAKKHESHLKDGYVEEWDTDVARPELDRLEFGMKAWYVTRRDMDGEWDGWQSGEMDTEMVEADHVNPTAGNGYWRFEVIAKDRQTALKIATERWARIRASENPFEPTKEN